MKSEIISVAEAARRLRVSIDYVYSLVWSGKLSARKIDGRWRVSADSVAKRISKREAVNA